MYKILIKYTSASKKTFWYSHETIQEDGTSMKFETDDLEVLKAEINKLDKQIGFENIRVVDDIDYDVLVSVPNDEYIEEITSKEIDEIYTEAYNKVFANDGEGE